MKVLVFATHPDDETLACGGTLLRHRAIGDAINWCICTEFHRSEQCDFLEKRSKEIDAVAKLYGMENVFQLKMPACGLDQLQQSEIIAKIKEVVEAVEPEIVYLPFYYDVHSDHRIIFESAFSVLKTFRSPSVKKIYMMETLSETEFAPSFPSTTFIPNVYIDISNYLEKKLDIMKIYKGEYAEHPFPRSLEGLEALAKLRGAAANAKYAESFMLVKEVQS